MAESPAKSVTSSESWITLANQVLLCQREIRVPRTPLPALEFYTLLNWTEVMR